MPWLRDYKTLSPASIHPSVCHVFTYINTYILVIYKVILTKFARNDYWHKIMFGLILKNKMATIADCLKSLACSKSLHVEASFIKFAQNVNDKDILPHSNHNLILRSKWRPYHLFKVKRGHNKKGLGNHFLQMFCKYQILSLTPA